MCGRLDTLEIALVTIIQLLLLNYAIPKTSKTGKEPVRTPRKRSISGGRKARRRSVSFRSRSASRSRSRSRSRHVPDGSRSKAPSSTYAEMLRTPPTGPARFTVKTVEELSYNPGNGGSFSYSMPLDPTGHTMFRSQSNGFNAFRILGVDVAVRPVVGSMYSGSYAHGVGESSVFDDNASFQAMQYLTGYSGEIKVTSASSKHYASSVFHPAVKNYAVGAPTPSLPAAFPMMLNIYIDRIASDTAQLPANTPCLIVDVMYHVECSIRCPPAASNPVTLGYAPQAVPDLHEPSLSGVSSMFESPLASTDRKGTGGRTLHISAGPGTLLPVEPGLDAAEQYFFHTVPGAHELKLVWDLTRLLENALFPTPENKADGTPRPYLTFKGANTANVSVQALGNPGTLTSVTCDGFGTPDPLGLYTLVRNTGDMLINSIVKSLPDVFPLIAGPSGLTSVLPGGAVAKTILPTVKKVGGLAMGVGLGVLHPAPANFPISQLHAGPNGNYLGGSHHAVGSGGMPARYPNLVGSDKIYPGISIPPAALVAGALKSANYVTTIPPSSAFTGGGAVYPSNPPITPPSTSGPIFSMNVTGTPLTPLPVNIFGRSVVPWSLVVTNSGSFNNIVGRTPQATVITRNDPSTFESYQAIQVNLNFPTELRVPGNGTISYRVRAPDTTPVNWNIQEVTKVIRTHGEWNSQNPQHIFSQETNPFPADEVVHDCTLFYRPNTLAPDAFIILTPLPLGISTAGLTLECTATFELVSPVFSAVETLPPPPTVTAAITASGDQPPITTAAAMSVITERLSTEKDGAMISSILSKYLKI